MDRVNGTGPLRILLVDDDALVRAGLALMLGGADDLEVVGEAGDGREALAQVARHRPDVVLMDLRMPELDGIEATRVLRSRPDGPRVVVLTTFDADDHVVRALAAGADGFLLKDTAPAQIVQAVRTVAGGDPILSPAITQQLIRQVTTQDSGRSAHAVRAVAELTARELDVAIAVGRGQSNAEIAAELHLSVATVKAHLSHLFTKLDATNRVQVAICMHDAGLL